MDIKTIKFHSNDDRDYIRRLERAYEQRQEEIKGLKEEFQQLQRVYNVTNNDWVESKEEIEQLKETASDERHENERLKQVLLSIYNIDTFFLTPEGSEREFNHKEMCHEIERQVNRVVDLLYPERR